MKRVSLIVVACLGAVFSATAAQADWRAFSTSHFIIYSESDDKAVEQLARSLETVDGLMRMATGLGTDVEPVKVRIYQVGDEGDVQRAIGETGSGIAGFYSSNILGPFAVTPRHMTFQQGDFTTDLVLHHEYAHHFMLQYFPGTYPGWYTEGFAELIGSSRIMRDGTIAYGYPAKHRGDEISFDWYPLQDLLLTPPEKIHGMDWYGEGWALTHFFTFSKTRSKQLREYLAALTAGKSRADAAKVFGDLGDLNREASAYLRAGSFTYRAVRVPIHEPVIQAVRALSPGEAALVPETIAFRDDDLAAYRKQTDRDHEAKLREETLEHIRAKAAQYPNDPYALYLLGEAEMWGGHPAEAEAAADRLLAIDPGHSRGMVLKSLAMADSAEKLAGPDRRAKALAARAMALKANRADTNDALALVAFYRSFEAAGEKAPDDALKGLAAAVATLPQDTRVRQMLVNALESQRRWAEAIAVLSPIANGLHESPQRAAAQEQMARLQAHLAAEKGAPPPSS